MIFIFVFMDYTATRLSDNITSNLSKGLFEDNCMTENDRSLCEVTIFDWAGDFWSFKQYNLELNSTELKTN